MRDVIRTTRAIGVPATCVSRAIAKGSVRSNALLAKRIVIAFDDETFDEIAERALTHKRSFAAEVRDLVEIGLETEKAEELERRS